MRGKSANEIRRGRADVGFKDSADGEGEVMAIHMISIFFLTAILSRWFIR